MKAIQDFLIKKNKQEKITMITCYDFSFAQIINQSHIDCLLVGDSVAQVFHGFPNTLHATIEMMAFHTAAVARGATHKFIVADMPFLSVRKGLKSAMQDIDLLMKAGAHAVKIENVLGHEKIIQHIIESGVPVMGHLGLTPQSIHQLGGPKIQGKSNDQAQKLFTQAKLLEQLGCFSLVLELIPNALATQLSKELVIPTIGIGAGPHTDGQVLVLNDLLGMNPDFNPKFLKKYLQGHSQFLEAFNQYSNEVKNNLFPLIENSY